MKIGKMDEMILIQKNEVTVDAIGNHKTSWTDYVSCHSSPSTYNVDESSEEVTYENRSVTFAIRYCKKAASLDAIHYRVIHRNQVYNIKAVDFMNFDHKTVKIRCTLEVRQNE